MPARTPVAPWCAALGAIVTAWSCVGSPLATAGDLRCVFEVTRETVALPALVWPRDDAPKVPLAPPKRQTFTLNLGLGRDALVCEEQEQGADAPGERIAYDFLARRVTTSRPSARSYRDTSLYAVVAFRVNELINRTAMAASLAAAQAGRPADERMPADLIGRYVGRFASETLFSLRLPPGPPPPKEAPFLQPPLMLAVDREVGPGWDFLYNGKAVVQFTPSPRPLPAEFHRTLRHFLAYRCSIHPDARDKILAAGVVPGALTFQYTDVGRLVEETVTLTLKVVRDAQDDPVRVGVPKGYEPEVDPARPLDLIVRKLSKRLGEVPRPDREGLARFVGEALKRGDDLDAYLALCEFTAETGDPALDVGAWIKKSESPQVRAFVAAFDKPTPEDLERRIQALESIDRAGLSKGYMIDALCASTLTLLGRTAEAEPRYLKALEANPLLVDAYVTLGTSRFQTFQIEDAWQAFDAARRIDPASPYLSEVKALETRLAADFPDEF
ncbi:MAG: tetratricopeptide repeat protein [Isosphaeraceae bacterium]